MFIKDRFGNLSSEKEKQATEEIESSKNDETHACEESTNFNDDTSENNSFDPENTESKLDDDDHIVEEESIGVDELSRSS